LAVAVVRVAVVGGQGQPVRSHAQVCSGVRMTCLQTVSGSS
jgi:hypothetical protein